MAINCNPPNQPCGETCISPGEVCGGKDNKLSPENTERLNKLSETAQKVKPKPPAPEMKDLPTRDVELSRRELNFQQSIRGKEPNEITLKERMQQRNLKRERESISFEKREQAQRAKEEALKPRQTEEEQKPEPEKKPETPEEKAQLGKAIFDALRETEGLLGEVTDTFNIQGLTELTGAARNSLEIVLDSLRKENN